MLEIRHLSKVYRTRGGADVHARGQDRRQGGISIKNEG